MYYLLALIISTPAWIWLLIKDWKTTLALLLIMWGNNISNIDKNK